MQAKGMQAFVDETSVTLIGSADIGCFALTVRYPWIIFPRQVDVVEVDIRNLTKILIQKSLSYNLARIDD
jgi:hypothetical protein